MSAIKLPGRMRSELKTLAQLPGRWSRVEPHNCDPDLAFYLSNGLVRHLGTGKGYVITDAGREALKAKDGR